MVQSSCSLKSGLKKGTWTPDEDQKLLAYIEAHGHGSWQSLPAKAGLERCGKSCRLRWNNYLRPGIKRGKFSLQEEQTIIQLHALLGNKWSAIACHLYKRTDNEIKNYWNTHLKKRLDKMGIDPTTHKPKTHAFDSTAGKAKEAANLSHMAQWESARLEAEARLVRESKPLSKPLLNHFSGNFAAAGASKCLDVLKAWQAMVSTPNDSLEFQNSTLNFSENSLTNPQLFGFYSTNNDISCRDEMINEWKRIAQVKETLMNSSTLAVHANASSAHNNNNNAWCTESFLAANENINVGINISNGISEIMVYDHRNKSSMAEENSTGDGNFNLDQDQLNYWNGLFNVVDAQGQGVGSGSPVFNQN